VLEYDRRERDDAEVALGAAEENEEDDAVPDDRADSDEGDGRPLMLKLPGTDTMPASARDGSGGDGDSAPSCAGRRNPNDWPK